MISVNEKVIHYDHLATKSSEIHAQPSLRLIKLNDLISYVLK